MIRPSADINGKEGSRLSTEGVVCPGDVGHQFDDLVIVEIVHPAGVNGDVNNQLCSFGERGVVTEGHLFWNQMLVWGKEVIMAPIVVVQGCIC